MLLKVFHTFLEGTESHRAGTCSPRPSKKYEKHKENDDFQWQSIKFLRETKLLNMSVGGQSPAQIPERIFLLKKIDKKNASAIWAGDRLPTQISQKLSCPNDFNTFWWKIVVFLRFFILFGRSPMTGAGSGRFPALWKSMKFLTRNNTFQEKHQNCLENRRFQLFLAGQGRPAQGSQTSKSVDFLRNLKVLNEKVRFYLRFSILLGMAKMSCWAGSPRPISLNTTVLNVVGFLTLLPQNRSNP